jgi:hypothetical protein
MTFCFSVVSCGPSNDDGDINVSKDPAAIEKENDYDNNDIGIPLPLVIILSVSTG